MATLTPAFRDFLPAWIARQPWYRGDGRPATRPVGYIRLEDPDGAVGMETHLVSDGSVVYQIPMTYRGAPLSRLAGDSRQDPAAALIARAEHSELGTRWIYDAVLDPAWVAAMTRLVASEGSAATRGGPPGSSAQVRGVLRQQWPGSLSPVIELRRVLTAGPPPDGPEVLGFVTRLQEGEADGSVAECYLAVLKAP